MLNGYGLIMKKNFAGGFAAALLVVASGNGAGEGNKNFCG